MDGSRDTCQSIQNLPKADPVSLWIAWPIFSRPFLYVFIIYHYGYIRFTKTKGTFPVSEKVLSEQLKEMISDGLIERIQYDEVPLRVEYVLTDVGKKTMPAVDMLYIWSIERLRELHIDIDPDAFLVHPFEQYDISMKRMLNDFEQTVDLMGLLEEYDIFGDDLRKLVEMHIQREGLQPIPTPPKSPEYDLR